MAPLKPAPAPPEQQFLQFRSEFLSRLFSPESAISGYTRLGPPKGAKPSKESQRARHLKAAAPASAGPGSPAAPHSPREGDRSPAASPRGGRGAAAAEAASPLTEAAASPFGVHGGFPADEPQPEDDDGSASALVFLTELAEVGSSASLRPSAPLPPDPRLDPRASKGGHLGETAHLLGDMSLDEALSLSLGSPRSAQGLPCAPPPRRDGDGKKRAGVPMNLRVLDQQLKRSLDVALKYATPLEKALNARLDRLNGDADAREEFFKKIDYLKEKRQEARRNDPDVRRQRALAHRVAAESPRRTLAEKHASVRSNRESFHSKRSERILSAYVRKTARVVKTKAERLEDEQRARPWLAALVLARNAVDTKRSYDRRTKESDQYGGGRAVKGAASRVQNLWRRKTEVDRGRRYRDSAKKISSYIAAKRTTMLMNRKGKAVDVIAHFLTENANARKHIHRVIKNLLKATRRIQRYWREFAVVSSHRLALLNMLWQDAETDYYRAAKARCHEVAEQRRVEIFAVGARAEPDAEGEGGDVVGALPALSPLGSPAPSSPRSSARRGSSFGGLPAPAPPSTPGSAAKGTPRGAPRSFGAAATQDARVKAQLDMVDMDLEDELRKLQRRRVPPSHRRDYLRKLLFECRRKFKVDLPDSTNLLANNAYAIAARLASIEDVRMLLRGGPGSRPATAASDDAGKEDLNSGAERIIGRLVANVRTKRRRRRVPDKRCWFRLFAHVGRDSIFDYVQECEADYATSADALKQQDVVAPLPARRSAQINKQGSVAMRRASRVIQAEALKAVAAQMGKG